MLRTLGVRRSESDLDDDTETYRNWEQMVSVSKIN